MIFENNVKNRAMKNIRLGVLPILYLAITSATLYHTQTPIQNISTKNNAFAMELYHVIGANEYGNIFFSPFSISTALAMTYAGVDGITAKEIGETMHFAENKPEFHIEYGKYLHAITENAKGNIEWSIANKLWGERRYQLQPSFVALHKEAYHSSLERVNFVESPEIAREEINDWVAAKTKDKIQDLLPEGSITRDTRLVLTNAIYFKGDWLYPFDTKKTKNQKFFLSPNKNIEVPFMNFEGALNYLESADYQIIRLPYAGDKQSMVVVLPKTADMLYAVSTQMNTAVFNQMLTAPKPLVHLQLPKFKMTLPISIKKYLKQLGMSIPFTNKADFSKMTLTNDLYISEVVHKAFIEVSEKGTEAAAATAAVMTMKSMAVPKPIPPLAFTVDHPFLMYIMDNDTKTILFMGRVMNPLAD
ncbi:MAG: serpin B [Dokdonia sp.]|jgi:serpin B